PVLAPAQVACKPHPDRQEVVCSEIVGRSSIFLDAFLVPPPSEPAPPAHRTLPWAASAPLSRVRPENEFRSLLRSERALTYRSEPSKIRVYSAFMASLALTSPEFSPRLDLLPLSHLADNELLRQLDCAVATQRQHLARLLLLL